MSVEETNSAEAAIAHVDKLIAHADRTGMIFGVRPIDVLRKLRDAYVRIAELESAPNWCATCGDGIIPAPPARCERCFLMGEDADQVPE